MNFSAAERAINIQKAENQFFDLIIIGGGITGAGIALDAASRGIKTLLLEKQDFAAGTSSRSTKLIHGGLRYLKQGEFGLVREVGLERAIVHKNAPHLVVPEKMLIPLIKDGTFGKWATSFGLWVYDKLANVKEDDQRQMLTKEETLLQEPLLKPDVVIGSGYYAEYRTDDARLTIEVLKKAVEYDASCFNYMKVTEFIYQKEKIIGLKAVNLIEGKTHIFKSKSIVNAAGPWVDELRELDNSKKGKKLHLTKGVHIVVEYKHFPLKQAIYFDVAGGRMIFAIPRHGVTYIGTTDTDYMGIKEQPGITKEDVDYLLNAVNALFPSIRLSHKEIVSTWSGLRPLIHEEGKSASELSRKDEIFESNSGLISIAGGKLTGYRKMAQRIVDKLAAEKLVDYSLPPCFTDSIKLTEQPFLTTDEVSNFVKRMKAKYPEIDIVEHIVHVYGQISEHFFEKAKESSISNKTLACLCEAYHYSSNHEMCLSLLDFYLQRSALMYFNPMLIHQFHQELKKQSGVEEQDTVFERLNELLNIQ